MDASELLTSQQANFEEMLEIQTQSQQAAQEYEMSSTLGKNEFDAVKSGIERLASVGEAMSQLTDRQSQQIAQ